MDLDLWILKVKEGQHLSEDELQLLCEYVRKQQRTPWLHLGSDLVDIFCWTTEIGLVRVQLWVGSLHSTTSCSLQARAGITEVHFLPFNPVDKRTAITYIDSDGNWHRVSKGAPEQIIELCEVKPDVKREAFDIIDKFADHGLPSLAVAQQVSSIGMFVSLLVVAVSFYIKGMIIAFSLGMGPIPWVIISEVFSSVVTTQKFWPRRWLSSLQELLNGQFQRVHVCIGGD